MTKKIAWYSTAFPLNKLLFCKWVRHHYALEQFKWTKERNFVIEKSQQWRIKSLHYANGLKNMWRAKDLNEKEGSSFFYGVYKIHIRPSVYEHHKVHF